MNRKHRCPPPEEAQAPEIVEKDDPHTDCQPDPHQDSQEDWEEEVESNNSTSLPSQSSWGAKNYNRTQSWNALNVPAPNVEEQAPTLTVAAGTRPPQRTVSIPNDIHVQHQQQQESQTVKPARPASIVGQLPVPALPASNATSLELTKPPVTKTVSAPQPPPSSVKSSQEGSRPTEPYFKTGLWCSSFYTII